MGWIHFLTDFSKLGTLFHKFSDTLNRYIRKVTRDRRNSQGKRFDAKRMLMCRVKLKFRDLS